jgi:hypothetical protein
VHRSDLGDVIEGKRVLGKAEERAGEQEKQEKRGFAKVHGRLREGFRRFDGWAVVR